MDVDATCNICALVEPYDPLLKKRGDPACTTYFGRSVRYFAGDPKHVLTEGDGVAVTHRTPHSVFGHVRSDFFTLLMHYFTLPINCMSRQPLRPVVTVTTGLARPGQLSQLFAKAPKEKTKSANALESVARQAKRLYFWNNIQVVHLQQLRCRIPPRLGEFESTSGFGRQVWTFEICINIASRPIQWPR